MKQIPSAPNTAIVSGDFEQFSPMELYHHFTLPERIVRWWPQVAEMEVRIGGAFHLSWPSNDWHLRGEYTALDPGAHLGFTWHWDHDPSHIPAKQVDIWFSPLFEHGSRIGIFHGPFDGSSEDQASRQGIVEGWIHFGMILAGLREGAVE